MKMIFPTMKIPYQAQTFYNIYSFKENIDSALNEALSLEALNGLSDYTSAAGNGSSFHTITTDTPGILVLLHGWI